MLLTSFENNGNVSFVQSILSHLKQEGLLHLEHIHILRIHPLGEGFMKNGYIDGEGGERRVKNPKICTMLYMNAPVHGHTKTKQRNVLRDANF